MGNDNQINIFESLDDPGQPYSCVQWGDIGQDGIPLIVETYGQLFDWFSTENSYGVVIVLDHNMVFRYYGSSNSQILSTVNQILTEINLIGDINSDEIINIQDIILLINVILNHEYISNADINNDGNIDVLDIVQLVDIILHY